MLLLGHRNQRITIVSTPFTPLWIRYWPKLRFSDSFDLVARYYNLDRELLQADRLFSQFKAAHVEKSIKTTAEVIEVLNENSRHEINQAQRSRPFWPSSPQHHVRQRARSVDS